MGQEKQFGICDLPGSDFENGKLKNEFIASGREPWLIFANSDVTNGAELVQMLSEYDYREQTRLLVLCDHCPASADWYGLLTDPALDIYAIVVERGVFAECGSFNFRLTDETNREFLCRASAVCGILFLECREVEWQRKRTDGVFMTNAYLLVRHLQQLRECGCMETALERLVAYANGQDKKDCFTGYLHEMMAEDQRLYEKLYLATAPFFIIRGNEICYGMLQVFADQLAEALKGQGQCVIETKGGEYLDNDEQIQVLVTEHFRGIIGFQAPILCSEKLCMVRGRRFNFWFDHPMFFHNLLDNINMENIFLCQDGDHADYINQYCANARGIQFPPGGCVIEGRPEEKIYDLQFMGTFFDERSMLEKISGQAEVIRQIGVDCAQFLLEHPDTSYNELRKMLFTHYPGIVEQIPFVELANGLWGACRIAPYVYRRRVVETILAAGYELHVYGDTWKAFPRQPGYRLIIHEEIPPVEMSREMSKAKISLNVMSWHKAGMTERIIDIMMAHSVCLTDETRYLKNHFTNMKDIVMFRLDQLEKLPGMIDALLANDELRRNITDRAYERALREHTWQVRSQELLQMVTEMEEGSQ